ncbi:major facilitator superfamily domain-containing protein [Aspergillus pseudotamarii]|uniref:Major facilitator superfamily domain-containing protein n=1 Tax=Aspergillus pseudotamarii TaxID=132259 RepID=A0A5N6SW63_ASPPS|nr:major facilitator superfamily domain-containing protein [Aspergillus pseudotamarii]KAE8138905.1 major facilitator superfamily domain-containing protein [Aspergillus pseudotamarii]
MSSPDSEDVFPPGTTKLEERQGLESEFKLSPTPSDDPDDPLNRSPLRKAVNFSLTCSYVFFTFVLVDFNSLAYRGYMSELGLTYATFNQASGSNFAGLAIGCLFFIPCVHRFAGLAGSISEAVVVITIVDLFFVHQHARMNGIFLFMRSLGSTGDPIAAGYIVVSMGWRWMWWMIAIFLGVNLILVLFFFEESKYIPLVKIAEPSTLRVAMPSTVDARRCRKSIRQRLAFVTKTDMPVAQHFYQPLLILFSFPAVAYTAVTYGTILAWFSANASSGSYFLLDEPYRFSPSAIGLFHLGGFLGTFIATLTIPALNDWFVVRAAKKNGGIFEPEMRLGMSIPEALLNCAGLLLYGIGLGRGLHWAVRAVGQGIYGFGFIITADVALTYLTDCYPDILGDALIAIVFIRNGFAMVVRFAFTPWITGMGIQNTFIVIGMLALRTVTLPILLMVYGKRARARTANMYRKYATRQPVHRKAMQLPVGWNLERVQGPSN